MSHYHNVYVLIIDWEFSKRYKCWYWMIGFIRFVFALNYIAFRKIEEKYQGVNLSMISVAHIRVVHHSVCVSSCALKHRSSIQGKAQVPQVDPRVSPALQPLTVWSWESYPTSLSLGFLLNKMTVMIPTSGDGPGDLN